VVYADDHAGETEVVARIEVRSLPTIDVAECQKNIAAKIVQGGGDYVLAACVQQGRSVFTFLHQSLLAYFRKQPPPTLLRLPP